MNTQRQQLTMSRAAIAAMAFALVGCGEGDAGVAQQSAIPEKAAPGIILDDDGYPAAPATSAEELIEKFSSGTLTSEMAVATYHARIDAIDDQGPSIHSIISLNLNALTEARVLDEERAAGRLRGPLHGVPVLVKDNIETRELPTTAGSLALAANDTGRDAPIIARLRDAGAIILGKTNLSEWANFRSYDSISGWSGIGRQTHNPHRLPHDPCGSSSGSGAGVAALLAPLAIGTETNGSITCPGAMNGVVGLKPTLGLMSRTHIVPIAASQDTAGPMARTVRDAALMLNAMAGSDPLDPATVQADERKENYLNAIDRGVSGMRIGVLGWAKGDNPEVIAAFDRVLMHLKTAGAEIVDIGEFEPAPVVDEHGLDLLLVEFKDGLNRYLEGAVPDVSTRTLDDLIIFNDQNAEQEMPLFDQSIFIDAASAAPVDDPDYLRYRAELKQATGPDGIDKMMRENDVAVLIAPSRRPAPVIAPYDGESAGAPVGAGWLAAVAGYPVMTVPMGVTTEGLPIGFDIMASAWADADVLAVGRAYEVQAEASGMPGLVAPRFRRE